jgi:hypothetical protein
MREKQQPIGICDHCLKAIPRDQWYTRRGPRLYCPGPDCRNTANSRNGAPARLEKLQQRIERGEWVNPRSVLSDEENRRLNAQAGRLGRKREVQAGTWRNPALSAEARAKLSRPRKHSGALHRAIEKLRAGTTADLTDEERTAYRLYQRALRLRRRDEVNDRARDRYRDRMRDLTDEERARLRAKWRAANQRRAS